MPPALSIGSSSPLEGIVAMPWAEGHREFWQGDTVRFKFHVKQAGDIPWTNVDGAGWSAKTPDVLTTLGGSFLDPGPHIIRMKAVRGNKSSRIHEFTYYVNP
jgi:hypothetical protein